VLLTTAAVVSPPAVIAPEVDPRVVCVDLGSQPPTQMCMHAANARALEAAAEPMAELVSLARSDRPGEVVIIEDALATEGQVLGRETVPGRTTLVVGVETPAARRDDILDGMLSNAAAQLVGLRACRTGLDEAWRSGDDREVEAAGRHAGNAEALARELTMRVGGSYRPGLGGDGDPGLTGRIGAMTDLELSRWIAMHAELVDRCQVPGEDVP
jgi:hypothetical protein